MSIFQSRARCFFEIQVREDSYSRVFWLVIEIFFDGNNN